MQICYYKGRISRNVSAVLGLFQALHTYIVAIEKVLNKPMPIQNHNWQFIVY